MGVLEAEHVTLEKLTADTERLYFNLRETWEKAALPQKQTIQTELFPDGLLFSERLHFFELRNKELQEMINVTIAELMGPIPTDWDAFAEKFKGGRDGEI